jgi:cyclomaltodextrinase / maltogenic alpha-amylase / neopullulanase
VKTLDCATPSELASRLKLGRYRHFKGNEYEVIGIARDSESMGEFVVYRALYGERGLWIRSLEMFTEIVEREGRRVPRFQYIGAG